MGNFELLVEGLSAPTPTDTATLIQSLNSICHFPPEQLAILLSKVEFREFETGWQLTTEGGKNEYCGIILKGIFKLERHSASGRHFIVDFCSEGAAISNHTPWVTKGPSELNIEALEPGKIALLHTSDFEQLFQLIPVWNEFVRKILDWEMVRLAEREWQLLSFSAEERHAVFLETRTHQIGRLLVKDIAAYLGITPVSLSRLNAKRMREKRRPPPLGKRGASIGKNAEI